jgi:hypothetical protein
VMWGGGRGEAVKRIDELSKRITYRG